jgi:PAS domain S-box-containing protein
MNTNNFVSLHEYVDQLLDAICVLDAGGRFVYVSAAFEHIFGYTPAEVIGRPMIELVFPDDREITLQTANEIISGKPQPHFENRYIRKDGQIIHIMWSARWLAAERLRIAVARDITKRKYKKLYRRRFTPSLKPPIPKMRYLSCFNGFIKLSGRCCRSKIFQLPFTIRGKAR